MRSVIYPAFVYVKRGIFYFGRRVPKDVQRFYGSPRVVLSLRTKSIKRAERQAQRIAAKLEEQWDLLRLTHLEERFGIVGTAPQPKLSIQTVEVTPSLTKAAETYLAGKGAHRPKTFRQAVDRAVSNMIGLAGDLPLGSYTRSLPCAVQVVVSRHGGALWGDVVSGIGKRAQRLSLGCGAILNDSRG